MSSHREAPGIAKDPVADNTDFYAFVSPDNATTVTFIANFIPLEGPDGGPNFYEFGDDVLYEIHVDNNGDGVADVTFQFTFTVELQNPNTFLYNTGPITVTGGRYSNTFNRQQFYSVTRVTAGGSQVLGSHLASPPVNIGPRSTPSYSMLSAAAVHALPGGATVFAGQRIEGFYVDLGSVFDLAALRPFQSLHLISTPASTDGVDSTKAVNVHSIAIRVPISWLTVDGSTPTDPTDSRSCIGAWASASRRKVMVRRAGIASGPWVQVSRLGNPLINEVIIPMGEKDAWNAAYPNGDSAFAASYLKPELQTLLPILYPGDVGGEPAFHNLSMYSKPRADLQAILLTGIPLNVVSSTYQTFTGNTLADMLRLNVAIQPSGSPNPLGILGGDVAGYPNGRRVFDDVATIEVRAIAGLTIPLVDNTFTPDPAAGLVSDFTDAQRTAIVGSRRYKDKFPYLGEPDDGYHTPS
jgi:hypothetical protein